MLTMILGTLIGCVLGIIIDSYIVAWKEKH